MLDSKYTKAVSTVISSQNEITSTINLSGSSIEYSLCDRTSTSTNRGNYFVSLNLPAESTHLPLSGSTSLLHPELQQLNVDKFVLAQIPYTAFTEYIDARSIELTVPLIFNGVPTAYTIYSSTYTSDKSLKYGESSPLLGDNVAFLFCDTIQRPYSGLTTNELGQLISFSSATTWNPTDSYVDRPSAISYLEVQGNVNAINSDRRISRQLAVSVPGGYPAYFGQSASFEHTYQQGGGVGFLVPPGHGFQVGNTITIDKDDKSVNAGYDGVKTVTAITYSASISGGTYDIIRAGVTWGTASANETGSIFYGTGAFHNYDIPVGFIALDKGLIALTHPKLVNNFAWNQGFFPSGSGFSGTDDDKHRVHFNTGQTYGLEFVDINTEFKTSAVCMALNGEFYISNNHTWDRTVALSQFGSFRPLYITEIGLYNGFGELIGVGKFSEPVVRNVDDIFTFYINLDM